MDLITPPAEVARAGLRALKTVALADGELHDLERRMMLGVQEHILRAAFDVDALPPIAPDELAAAVPEGPFRDRILSACVVMALIDGDASADEGALLDRYARALGIESAAVATAHRLIHRQLLIARIDITRRAFIGQRGRAYLAANGIRGFTRLVRGLLGVPDAKLAARYQALERLPRGLLGREYYESIRENGFALPGEEHGPPEIIAFHDCLHVLAEYDTSSLEETQIASFQAGMLQKDPVFGLLFMLSQFHLGIQVTPVTPGEKLVADPQLMLQAFVRGTNVNRNLCVDWTPQQDFERPVEELRREFNIEPRITVRGS